MCVWATINVVKRKCYAEQLQKPVNVTKTQHNMYVMSEWAFHSFKTLIFHFCFIGFQFFYTFGHFSASLFFFFSFEAKSWKFHNNKCLQLLICSENVPRKNVLPDYNVHNAKRKAFHHTYHRTHSIQTSFVALCHYYYPCSKNFFDFFLLFLSFSFWWALI